MGSIDEWAGNVEPETTEHGTALVQVYVCNEGL
jgi:hypothetical protein